MSNDNKILDFTITLYSNKLKIVKEVSCKPTELEKVIDELDKQASVPKRGDGHHGFYIEVEVRRHKDVNIKRTSRSSKRQSEPAARKASAVHSGGRGSADDSKSRGDNRSVRSGIRSGGDGVSGSKGRRGKAPEAEEVSRRAGARSERAVRDGVRPARSEPKSGGKRGVEKGSGKGRDRGGSKASEDKPQGARKVSRKKER
jgi:hypothetical protein